jgi:hypothetical protein
MNTKSKLELTWITDESSYGRKPHVRLELAEQPPRDDSPVRSLEAGLSVCQKPRCGCLDICFQWLPATATAATGTDAVPPPRSFWFNLDKMTVSQAGQPDSKSLRLAEVIRAGLTEEDQQQLREWYLAEKMRLIHATSLGKTDLTGLPDASDGAMVAFVDVFPLGLALYFNWNQEIWTVFEQYCVQPDCDCKETMLSFIKVKDAEGRKITEAPAPPTLRHNYRTNATRPEPDWPEGRPSAADLMSALQFRHPDLNSQLQLRHLILKGLYLQQDVARLRRQLPALEDLPPDAPLAIRRKIGRNEPCPCGSGRKYKHCCLNQPRPAPLVGEDGRIH